jgi:hypothetical protein
MSESSESETSTRRPESRKSLKEQNLWQLWIIVAVNSLLLYGVVHTDAIRINELDSFFKDPEKLVPVGVAALIATVLNGVLSPDMKARLVFLRWMHALPGHRAFSQYAAIDSRIGRAALRKTVGKALPRDPFEQNRMWYKLYKTVEKEPAVNQAHRD